MPHKNVHAMRKAAGCRVAALAMELKTVNRVIVREIARNVTFMATMKDMNGVIDLNSVITGEIRAYSRDDQMADSLLALMDWYGVTRLADISDSQGQEFLDKLERGEIRIYG